MSSPTPTALPFATQGIRVLPSPGGWAQQWHNFKLIGIQSPGHIPRGGVEGFERETGWDEQAGKGSAGAVLILKSLPLVKGAFTCELINNQDFQDWDAFVSQALSIAPAKQKAQGLPIYYPSLSSVGLTSVVIAKYSGPIHMGNGNYHCKIHMIEWTKPIPKSIVQQPNSTAPDAPSAGVPLDPRIQDGQDDVASALLAQAAAAADGQ